MSPMNKQLQTHKINEKFNIKISCGSQSIFLRVFFYLFTNNSRNPLKKNT